MASNHQAVAQPVGDMEQAVRSLLSPRTNHNAARIAVEARTVSPPHGFNCNCSRCSRYDAGSEAEESTARGVYIDAETGQLVEEVTF